MSPEEKINQLNIHILLKNNPLLKWIYSLKSLFFQEVNNVAVKKIKYATDLAIRGDLCEKKNLNSIKLIKY